MKIGLAEYAFREMYINMRAAEKYREEYDRDYGHVATDEAEKLSDRNKWCMQQAGMYAGVFLAAEVAEDSPNYKKYQEIIADVEASWRTNQIPEPRVAAR